MLYRASVDRFRKTTKGSWDCYIITEINVAKKKILKQATLTKRKVIAINKIKG